MSLSYFKFLLVEYTVKTAHPIMAPSDQSKEKSHLSLRVLPCLWLLIVSKKKNSVNERYNIALVV